ncbi:MAG TPA: response regulator [Steroidobacteraceae bacterium]
MNILLVEDSEAVACITTEYLRELGHAVLVTDSAENALILLEDTPFDAVITDISLPGMSGIQLARELLISNPNLPIIISSGYQTIGLELNTVTILPKPFDLSELERALTEAGRLRGSA